MRGRCKKRGDERDRSAVVTEEKERGILFVGEPAN